MIELTRIQEERIDRIALAHGSACVYVPDALGNVVVGGIDGETEVAHTFVTPDGFCRAAKQREIVQAERRSAFANDHHQARRGFVR